MASPLPRSAAQSPARRVEASSPPKDFGFLLRPEIYHPLTALNIPLSFRNSTKQPGPNTPISDLIARGHFRAAAIAAIQELTSGSGDKPGIDPQDHRRIFELLHVRLACLTLIDATPLAAQEVKAFEDLNNPALYVDDVTAEHLVPWDLRVLNVRLQALGFGDSRRAVMSYYDLAREAREQIGKAASRHDITAAESWKSRLYDLGIKIAGVLIEMEDFSGAAHHLTTLRGRGDGKMELCRALLWLQLGEVDAARRAIPELGENPHLQKVVSALSDMADGEFAAALDRWKELRQSSDDEMIGVNMAICLIYAGDIDGASIALEELVNAGYSSHTLLTNLSTIYELCTDRHRNLKVRLAERVANMQETSRGWEKSNADFKL